MSDRPTRGEVAGLLTALRTDPKLRGFVSSTRIAIQTGLPAMAYHRTTHERLTVRRPIGAERGRLIAEMRNADGSVKTVATDEGVPGRPRPGEGDLRNLTVRISLDMRRRLSSFGQLGEVIRMACEEFLDRQDGASGVEAEGVVPMDAGGYAKRRGRKRRQLDDETDD